MRVALIFPGIALTGFDSYGKVQDSTWIHHGLCMLSACARQDGHEVRLFDMRRMSGYDDLVQQLTSWRPDVVGITAMSIDFETAIRTARAIKAQSDVPIVVGGPHATLATDAAASCEFFDYIVRGEGEVAFIDLLDDLQQGDTPQRITTGEHPVLEDLPWADREIFGGPEESFPDPDLPGPLLTLLAGRGCIYNCRFCQPAEREIFGPRVQRRSVENVIGEIAAASDTGKVGTVMLHDDCLTESPEWVSHFCEEYRRLGLGAPFVCQSRADLLVENPEMVRAMAEAGLRMLIIGFESGNQRVLDFIGKGTTVEQNLAAATLAREHGVKVWANYMLGLPTETREELLDTVRMVKEIDPDVHSPAFYTPHPGSYLYDYCREHDLLLRNESYDRTPRGRKVRGVNYRLVRWACDEATGVHDLPASRRLRIRVGREFDRWPWLKQGVRRALRRIRSS